MLAAAATAALAFHAPAPMAASGRSAEVAMMAYRKSVKNLQGYKVGERAPSSAVRSGTTKARSMKGYLGGSKRLQRGSLVGYTVGSRAPEGAVSSGTTARLVRGRGAGGILDGDLGVLPPLGIWDPLGLIETRDMRRYEIMEIKHGRAAMLGFIHVLAIESGLRFPTSECAAAPAGLVASFESMPTAAWLQIMVTTCMMENGTFLFDAQTEEAEVGDIGGDAWLRFKDPEVKMNKLNAERQNGRAAMLGITGCLLHEIIGGVDALYPTGGYGGAAPPTIF